MASRFLMKTFLFSFFLLPAFTFAAPLFEGPKGLLSYKYEMKISAPLAEMMKERDKEQSYDGELQIRLLGSSPEKEWDSTPIKIFVRGKSTS